MPELPEVEAVTLSVRRAAPWARIVACGQYRPTTMSGAEHAIGSRLVAIDRRGKNILARLDNGAFLRIHLKMTGNLQVLPDARLHPATVRAWFNLDDGRALALDDPRALGRISYHSAGDEPSLFKDLGPEPFDPAFTIQHLAAACRTTKPIKLLLMEQRAVAGLGNIYAAEALHHAAIHPAKPASSISRPRLARLHAAILDTLRLALPSALAAYSKPGGFSEAEDFPLAVYGRKDEPCPRCSSPIGRIAQAGRSTYYCPKCQK